MRSGIKKTLISLVLAITVILVSIPLWNYSNGKNVGIIADGYNDLNINVKIGSFNSLLVMDDSVAMSTIIPTDISFRNRNGFKKDFDLIMLVDKSSTISYGYVRVSIDDKIYNLSELEVTEDDNNYYFTLERKSINAYTTETVKARIWLSTNVEGLDSTSSLTTNFITK